MKNAQLSNVMKCMTMALCHWYNPKLSPTDNKLSPQLYYTWWQKTVDDKPTYRPPMAKYMNERMSTVSMNNMNGVHIKLNRLKVSNNKWKWYKTTVAGVMAQKMLITIAHIMRQPSEVQHAMSFLLRHFLCNILGLRSLLRLG